jgi:hypothetical protein
MAPRDGYKTHKFVGFYRARTNQIEKYPLNCPPRASGPSEPLKRAQVCVAIRATCTRRTESLFHGIL